MNKSHAQVIKRTSAFNSILQNLLWSKYALSSSHQDRPEFIVKGNIEGEFEYFEYVVAGSPSCARFFL